MRGIRIISVSLLLLLTGCGGNRQTDTTEYKLNSNSTVTDYFSREEIKVLAKLLDFFNEQICLSRDIDKKRMIDCHDSYNERMFEMAIEGYFDLKISCEKQHEIFNQICDSLYYQIWYFDKDFRRNSPNFWASYNSDGKYLKFLDELGKECEMIKKCCEDLRAAGDISPTWVAEFMMIKKGYNYDLTDIRLQLVVALHYLTWNDRLCRIKEKGVW